MLRLPSRAARERLTEYTATTCRFRQSTGYGGEPQDAALPRLRSRTIPAHRSDPRARSIAFTSYWNSLRFA